MTLALARRALFALTLLAGPAQAQQLDKISFGTNWVAEAEHGGFYQAVADGTYAKYGLDVTIVPGGPQVNNRIPLLAGKIDFFMSANSLQGFDAVDAEHPDHRGRGDLPEGPAGAARASRTGGEVRGPEEPHAARLRGGAADLFQMDAGGVRLRAGESEALHLQSRTVPGRQTERDAGLCDVGAVRDREGRQVQAEDLPARRSRLQHLLDPDRNAPRGRREEARPGAALRRCLGESAGTIISTATTKPRTS